MERYFLGNPRILNHLKATAEKYQYFSVCLHETTDVISLAKSAVIVRYSSCDTVKDNQERLLTLSETTKGKDIRKVVYQLVSKLYIHKTKITLVTIDVTPSMVCSNVGFVTLF
jgi:uncharacterized membrane protein